MIGGKAFSPLFPEDNLCPAGGECFLPGIFLRILLLLFGCRAFFEGALYHAQVVGAG